MKKRYIIREQVNHYHIVEIDTDELDMAQIVEQAFDEVKRFDTGYEAVADKLEYYKDKYRFDFKLTPNDSGTDCVGMELWDEDEINE